MTDPKTFEAVVSEDPDGRLYAYAGYSDHTTANVLNHDSHKCKTVQQMVTTLDRMASAYGWTITQVWHRKDTSQWIHWRKVR